MRWALVGPLHPYRGGIAHYGALLASDVVTIQVTGKGMIKISNP